MMSAYKREHRTYVTERERSKVFESNKSSPVTVVRNWRNTERPSSIHMYCIRYREIIRATMNTDPGYSYIHTCTSCVVLRMPTSSLRLVKSSCHLSIYPLFICDFLEVYRCMYRVQEIITDIIQSVD